MIVGLQYGDEGKGKITDILAQQADWVIRFNGGSNAGHTIWLGGHKVVTHSIPSGVLYTRAKNYIGAGCVVDPVALRKELDDVAASGFPLKSDRLKIDARAHLTLPIHLALDGVRESSDKGIGTTKRGIGPTYVTKLDRVGIRAGDLVSSELSDKVKSLCHFYNPMLKAAGAPESSVEVNQKAVVQAAEWMREYLSFDATPFYDVSRTQNCVLEGAQGILLDVDHGGYPYVTSSTTLASGAGAGGPFPMSRIGMVIGIAKAYLTRVGQGELVTELNDATGERIRKNGAEFGATTGRPRRVGWLNLDELRLSVRLTDCSAIVLSKADVLMAEKEVKVWAGGKLETFAGWDSMNSADGKTLSTNLESFVSRIESFVGVPIIAVGTGTDRSDLFWRHPRPDFWKA